jgi:hypothetical protein
MGNNRRGWAKAETRGWAPGILLDRVIGELPYTFYLTDIRLELHDPRRLSATQYVNLTAMRNTVEIVDRALCGMAKSK